MTNKKPFDYHHYFSAKTNKQTKKLQKVKNLLNFWKGFIRHCTNADPKAPAHIPVVNLILGAKCLR